MIPLELRLTNFLSYRQPATVNLRDVHLASISGPNGAGKSSLLDAVIWALFGKSRAKSDDDVVNTAADGDGAEIEFVFDMEGTMYRILRRKRPRKTSEVEFQIGSGDSETLDTIEWTSLTEGTKRETEASIVRTLRMNYDVFVNASFFLQGKADAFTSSNATRRKEILAEILDVTKWDNFGKQAAARRKEAESEVELLRRRLEEVNAELSEAEERQQRLSAALEQEAAIRARLDDKELLLNQARQIRTAVEKQKQQLAAQETELTTLQREVERLQQRIAEREQERGQFESIVSEAAVIEDDYANWTAADEAFRHWQQLAEQVRGLQAEQNPLQLRIATERSRLEQRRKGLEAQEQAQAARQIELDELREQVVSSKTQLAELTKESEGFGTKEAELRQIELEMERQAAEQRQLEQELQRLSLEEKRIEGAVVESQTLEKTLQDARTRAAELSEAEAAAARAADNRAGWTAELDQLASQCLQWKEDAGEVKESIAKLTGETGGDCPLCGQALTAEHRQTVVSQLETNLAGLRQKYGEAKERQKSLEAQLQEQGDLVAKRTDLKRRLVAEQEIVSSTDAKLRSLAQSIDRWSTSGDKKQLADLLELKAKQTAETGKAEEIESLRRDLARKAALDREINLIQQQIARSESRLEQIESDAAAWTAEGSIELDAVGKQLDEEAFAPDERLRLAEIQEKIDALGYDAAEHAASQQRLSALSTAPERYQSLGRAQAALKPLADALAESSEQLTERVARQNSLKIEYEAASVSLASLEESAVDTEVLEDQVSRLREEMSIASQNVGATKQKVAVLDDRLRQMKTYQEQQRVLELRIQHLKQLEEACGRKGVQALLIEHALPEIEERANELLDRLSGGAMRVRFETQRPLKSREDVTETLDIHISDAVGERPYENFSGGEQFRVNFAVRLALSQALAHRAGAPLRTLVIDEGFGSQDPEGRQRLIEAINAVQTDFACVLVITHIDELRDAFPARIEVVKSGAGSQVEVIAGL